VINLHRSLNLTNHNLNPTRFAEAARFGFRVFPVKKAGKEPAVPSWKAVQASSGNLASMASSGAPEPMRTRQSGLTPVESVA